jgi:hypothetical protein
MRRAGLLLCGMAAALGFVPSTALADFGLVPGGPKLTVVDGAGDPYTQAGGHPDRIRVQMDFDDDAGTVVENPKEIAVRLPAGLTGNVGAVPLCSRRTLEEQACDPESQVGVLALTANGGNGGEGKLFGVESAPGEAATVAAILFGKLPFTLQIRPDDFGMTVVQSDITQTVVLESLEIELWGVPADRQEETEIPRRPFIGLPARCDRGPLSVTVEMRSWQQPDRWVSASSDTGMPLTGCSALSFQPSIGFDLLDPKVDSPTGAAIGFQLPPSDDPDGRTSVATKAASVTLPPGLSISPGVSHGLTACADVDLHKGSSQPAACPISARVGTVELAGPQLRAPLAGNLYLGEEHPGERFRLFAVAEGMGVSAKLVGALQVDAASGRITAKLDDLPELALSDIDLRFEDGPRALLATPLTCGPLTATGIFTPHGDFQPVQSSDAASVEHGVDGGACPGQPPFSPQLGGSSTEARAGAATGVAITLRRQSGEQLPDRLSAELPRGLTAALGSVDRCGEPGFASGSCPAASRVGSVVGEVGSGPRPARLAGDIYLGGPYRGAPFSLALAFRSKIGPFDLGTSVTRAALRIDRESGRVSIETDALPRTIEGIPVRFRTIGFDLDRPGFIHNPTSCDPAAVEVAVRSATGGIARSSSPFTVTGCEALDFHPKLSVRMTRKAEIRVHGSPGMTIGIRARGGETTNMKGADIALPSYLRLNSASKREICARQAAREGRCQAISKVGMATGRTPLLSSRLSGSIYLVQPEGSGPPELWTSLDAMGVRFDVHSKLSSRRGHVHTSLVDLPDIPITELALQLKGGKRGILSLKSDPCASKERRARATVGFEGQNRAYRIDREPIEGCKRVGRG